MEVATAIGTREAKRLGVPPSGYVLWFLTIGKFAANWIVSSLVHPFHVSLPSQETSGVVSMGMQKQSTLQGI